MSSVKESGAGTVVATRLEDNELQEKLKLPLQALHLLEGLNRPLELPNQFLSRK